MTALRLSINPQNPQERLISQVVSCLEKDGVIIYPTDTVYALGCDIRSKKAIEKLCRIKGVKPEKARLSCICSDLSIIGDYAIRVSNEAFKIMRLALPGPYTFILQASKNIPRHFQSPAKTVGIRIPDHEIPVAIVRMLGNPIVTTTIIGSEEYNNYPTDPDELYEQYHKVVDIVVDGGECKSIPSTVIDCSDEKSITIQREAAGDIAKLGIVRED